MKAVALLLALLCVEVGAYFDVEMKDFVVKPRFVLEDDNKNHQLFKKCFGDYELVLSVPDLTFRAAAAHKDVEIEEITSKACNVSRSFVTNVHKCGKQAALLKTGKSSAVDRDFVNYLKFLIAIQRDTCQDEDAFIKSSRCMLKNWSKFPGLDRETGKHGIDECGQFGSVKNLTMDFFDNCKYRTEAVGIFLDYYQCEKCSGNKICLV